MKILVSLLAIFLIGCSSTDERIDRTSGSYKIAKSLHGRNAKEEFEKNRKSGDLLFYAIATEVEDKYTIPGLTKEDMNLYIDKMDIGFEVIDDFLNIHISTEGKSVNYYYSIIVEEFAEDYNRLVLNEYKQKAYQGASHNGRRK